MRQKGSRKWQDAKIDPQSAVVRGRQVSNIIVVRKGEETREDIKRLVAALQSPELEQFLKEKFGAAIIPAF